MAKIMVIDDSETLRTQLKADLTKAGHEVVEAHDGLHGLELIEKNGDVQLIFCDVNMPRLDGLSMCERVREKGWTKPIVMLTTESNAEMKIRGKAAGITAWITKPYVREKLLMAVDKIIGTK